MIKVDNKFEIRETAFTVYRVPVEFKCPVCEGKGTFIHNNYEVKCAKCSGTGKLKDAQHTLLAPTEVTVSSIKVSYNGTNLSVKYKVNSMQNIRNRSEETMFKTIEEAEDYCKCVNTKEAVPEF